MSFILSVDQGTTQTKCLILDQNGNLIASHAQEFAQHYPKTSWVEHLNHDIKKSIKESIEKCIIKANILPSKILAIGITNQRETTCLFDKNSESPIPFIVWQCKRSFKICEQKTDLASQIQSITGLKLDPYFSASKLSWIFENYPEFHKKAKEGKLLFGTIDSFLAHWFTNGKIHITDVTNASRTMLMDINSLTYNDFLLDAFNVPKNCLPQIVKNTGVFGLTKGLSFLPDGIPICALIGDQQSAMIAQKCFLKGDAKLTLGTGAFLLQNIGQTPNTENNSLLCSVAFQINEKPFYCFEGVAFTAGASVQFLRDNLEFGKTAQEIDALSKTVSDTDGVVFIPALCGLGAPYWKSDFKALFLGLTRGTKKAHMAKAVLESIALQNAHIFSLMNPLLSLKIDGGMSSSDLIMQMHADFLFTDCLRDKVEDKTALGAALLAGLGAGLFNDISSLSVLSKNIEKFSPKISKNESMQKLDTYKNIINKILTI